MSSLAKSNATASSLPKCRYFDEMAFLYAKILAGLVKVIYSCNELSFYHSSGKWTYLAQSTDFRFFKKNNLNLFKEISATCQRKTNFFE